MYKVAILTGSTRPQRIGLQVAEWVMSVLQTPEGVAFELIDLAEWNLPLLDEPRPAALNNYEHEHTKRWSQKIGGFDGFIFVTPQYNWGYPAALKNALDYLYAEWSGKPAATISYGFHGGGKAAAQLRQVLEGLRMRPADTMPAITITKEMHGEDGQLTDVENSLRSFSPSIQTATEELAALLNQKQQGSP